MAKSEAATGPSDQADGGPAYPITSVGNALELLLLFRERSQVRIMEAAEQIGVARSTAHRLMQMLVSYGFVRQDPDTKVYVAGPKLVDIGLQAVRDMDIPSVARPFLERLVEEMQETVNLFALNRDEVLCVDSIESPRHLRVGSPTGLTLPAHASAAGKVLLAQLPVERLRQIYPNARLPGMTPQTITTRKALEAELKVTRERGYGVNRSEIEPDISAVAVPIRTGAGQGGFAITVAVPTFRLAEGDVPRIAEAAIACTEQIAAQLPW